MYIVKGNKTEEISQEKFRQIIQEFNRVEIDLGTGNGRFVFKKALENPQTLYMGIDPVEKQLQKYSRKAVRKKLENVLFVLGAAENLSEIPGNIADRINILLPWGSLLDYVANFDKKIISNIKGLMKPDAHLRLVFGYTEHAEPTETERLNLEKLNEPYIRKELIPRYESAGLKLQEIKQLSKEDLRKIETSWSKKLSFGKPRPIFLLELENTG